MGKPKWEPEKLQPRILRLLTMGAAMSHILSLVCELASTPLCRLELLLCVCYAFDLLTVKVIKPHSSIPGPDRQGCGEGSSTAGIPGGRKGAIGCVVGSGSAVLVNSRIVHS